MKNYYYSLESKEKIEVENIKKILVLDKEKNTKEISCIINDLNFEDYVRVWDKEEKDFVLIKTQNII